MTHTQRFIELAIEGGWIKDNPFFRNSMAERNKKYYITNEDRQREGLLDPLAWQAVGKVKGWPNQTLLQDYTVDGDRLSEPTVLHNWHRFVVFLWKGKSIEEALGEILK